MNVIFLDFDGTLNTCHDKEEKFLEKRIKILADICKEYNCKIVIESTHKNLIDEETLEVDKDALWIQKYFDLFKKYDIEVIGRTPEKGKKLSSICYIPVWKENEIRLYLFRHPEIEHYCVIDDDDMHYFVKNQSDLNKVRKHLVQTIYYSLNPDEEGLLEKHKEEVGKVLKLDNEIKKLILLKERKKR